MSWKGSRDRSAAWQRRAGANRDDSAAGHTRGGGVRRADLVFACALCGAGVAALISTSRMRVGAAAAFQPRLFPAIVGWLLIAASVALAADGFRRSRRGDVEWPTSQRALRIAVMLASVSAHVGLIDVIGMPLATFLSVTFQVWYLGDYRWHVPVLTGAAAAAVVYAVFMYGLGLSFPTGLYQ